MFTKQTFAQCKFAHKEPCLQMLPWYWEFSLWRRKGKAFCVRQCAWHCQQPETDKQNVVFAPPWKNLCWHQWGTQVHVKKLRNVFFIKRFTLKMDPTLIVFLKHI